MSGVIREAINYIALKKKKKITDIRKWKNNEDENLWEGEGPTAGESDGAVSPPHPDLLYKRLKETIQVAVIPGRRPLQRLQDKIFWL